MAPIKGLQGLHKDWEDSSYTAERDALLKKRENPDLAGGKPKDICYYLKSCEAKSGTQGGNNH
jgi:hypothetical protein